MVRRFRFSKATNAEVNSLSRNVVDFANQFYNIPILDGLLIPGIECLASTPTTINHGLGRPIRGYQIVYQNADARLWALDENQTLPSSTLVLNCSANVTINLWVF